MKEQINRLKVVLVEQQRTNNVKTLLEIARHLNVDVKELLNSSKS